MTLRVLTLAVVLVSTFSFAKPPTAQVVAQLKKEQVKPFEAKVRELCGPRTKATVKLEAPPDAESRPYPVKDVGAFLAAAARSGDLTRNSLDQVTEALKEVTSDAVGKKAVADGLAEVVVYAAVGDGFLTFEKGVLTVGSHIFGDGEGSSISASDIEKRLLLGLMVDDPTGGGEKVPVGQAKAMLQIETKHLAPFRAKVTEVLGPTATVTAKYSTAPGETQPVKDVPGYVMKTAASTNFTINMLDNVVAALKEPGRKPVKAVVVYVVVGDSLATLTDGVLSVGGHTLMDGAGNSLHQEQVSKALKQ